MDDERFLDYDGLKRYDNRAKEELRKKQDRFEIDETLTRSDENVLGVTLPIKAATKAEYNALSEEEKMAEVVYVIEDDNESGSGGGSAEEIYSTEETRIGTWIDGKPLYRKVIIANSGEGTNTWIPIANIHDMDELTHIFGTLDTNNSGRLISIPNLYCQFIQNNNNNKNEICFFTSNQSGSYSNKKLTLSVEYTKTTDQATTQSSDAKLDQTNRPSVESPSFDFTATTSSAIEEV